MPMHPPTAQTVSPHLKGRSTHAAAEAPRPDALKTGILADPLLGATGADRVAPAVSRAGGVPHGARLSRQMGVDLSGVRVTKGDRALENLNAEAAAEPEHLRFAESSPSLGIAAHEVIHLMQSRIFGAGAHAHSAPSDRSEAEAERLAIDVQAGRSIAQPRERPSSRVMLSSRKKQKGKNPKVDKYNSKNVRNNTTPKGNSADSKNVKLASRPGIAITVTTGASTTRIDRFPLLAQTTMLFGDGSGKCACDGEVRLNQVPPKDFHGTPHVLAWRVTGRNEKGEWLPKDQQKSSYMGSGSGWIPLESIGYQTNTAQENKDMFWTPITDAAKGASKNLPKKTKVSTQPSDSLRFKSEATIRNEEAQLESSFKDRHVISGGQTDGSNEVLHHWARPVEHRVDASTPAYAFNVFLSLPRPGAAAVAADVAKPGEKFERYQIKPRKVPRYAQKSTNGKRGRLTGYMIFYYGRVNGDDQRRGWVWDRCLE